MTKRGPTPKTALFKTAMCPYFIRDDKKILVCESTIEGAKNHTVFMNNGQKEKYSNEYCKDKWKMCPLAYLQEYMMGEE